MAKKHAAKGTNSYSYNGFERGVSNVVYSLLSWAGLGDAYADIVQAIDSAQGYDTKEQALERRLLQLSGQLTTRLNRARKDYDQSISNLNAQFSDEEIQEALQWADNLKYQVTTTMANREEVLKARQAADAAAKEARKRQNEKESRKSALQDSYNASTNQVYNDYATETGRATQYATSPYSIGDTGLLHSITKSFKEE